MYPRLYIQTMQYVFFNKQTKEVVFETRYVTGRRYHFILNLDQFIALDNTITLINANPRHGHYPLGQNMWFHFNDEGVTLYRNTHSSNRINFVFENFEEYKSYVHKRLYSLIRSTTQRVVTRRRNHERSAIKTHKRTLSDELWSTTQSPTPKQHCGQQRETSPRPSLYANLSTAEQTCSIFSKWDSANPRRRNHSFTTSPDRDASLASPSSIQLNSPSSITSMESE